MDNGITIQANDYDIVIGPSSLVKLVETIKDIRADSRLVFVLVDENSKKHCLPLIESLSDGLFDGGVIEIESGESNKTITSCDIIWKALTDGKADRTSVLVNLGGGVIGDMGGFAASTFKRGIPFIQVPTTILAQVDASVGGKLGVDFNGLKNLIGVFNNPLHVYVFPGFVSTLDPNHVRSGYAEVLKHGLIADRNYWDGLKHHSPDKETNWLDVIAGSVKIKNEVVNQDPHEKGIRKSLNFGHTIGHAVETLAMLRGNTLLHGDAIAVGMVCESFLSVKYAGLSKGNMDDIMQTLTRLYGSYRIDNEDFKEIWSFMKNDKKNSQGRVNFSLISDIGQYSLDHFCSEEDVNESLKFYIKGLATKA